jgi:hypothetical protein
LQLWWCAGDWVNDYSVHTVNSKLFGVGG